MAQTHGAVRGLTRLEGFSDAVFAIALTLLIIEIKPPGAPDGPQVNGTLVHAVAAQWREHLALLLSFLVIGVYWLHHHYSGRIYVKSDYLFGVLNLAFLLAVTFVPYPLRIWCFNVGTERERAASVVLTLGLFAPTVFWLVKWFYGLRNRRLMDGRLTSEFMAQTTKRYVASAGTHAISVPLAFFEPRVGVALAIGTVVYFLFPQPKPRYKPGKEPSEEEAASE